MKTRIVLGIDYGTREFGYATFHDGRLQDWNVKSIRRTSPRRDRLIVLRQAFARLLIDTQPGAMAMTRHGTAYNDKLQIMSKVDRIMKSIAAERRIAVHQFDPVTIKKVVTGDSKATKRMEAKGVVALFPEVRLYLNDAGWQERYLQRMFGAIAAGSTYFTIFENPPDHEQPNQQ